VSLLFRDCLFIEISPCKLSAAIQKKGLRSKMQSLGSASFVRKDDEPQWVTVVNMLKQWLLVNKYQSTDIQLAVSDSFTRYVLLPWPSGIKKKSEFGTLAKIHFDASFGPAGRYANIVFDFESYEQPGVACAIESDFLNALKDICNSKRNRLISIEPHFVKTFNLWRNRIGKEGLVVCVEDGHCVMSFIKDDHWKSIRAIKFSGAIQEALPLLIEREVILQGGGDTTRIYLDLDAGESPAVFLKMPQIHILGRTSAVSPKKNTDVMAGAA
jgi:hypothetical protein